MLIDLHVHEQTFSPCGRVSLERIVDDAHARGLDAVCITDHDSMGLRERAHAYAREVGFPILVGAEIYTLEGDMVTFGLTEVPPTRIAARELLEMVSEDGFSIAAHPFRGNGRGLGDALRTLADFPSCSGVEVLNGNTGRDNNRRAWEACERLGLPKIASSDSHWAGVTGKYATRLPDGIACEADLVAALRSGDTTPCVWTEDAGYVPVRTPDEIPENLDRH